jgi:signal peptidase
MTRLLRALCPLFVFAVVLLAVALHSTHRVYAVQTGSMAPGIPAKSLVVVEVGRYHLGQPVSFHSAHGVVTHRLVSRNADGTYVTKGDANNAADVTPVSATNIIGGVVVAAPGLGFWWVYISRPLGTASIAASLLMLYLVWGLFATAPGPERTRFDEVTAAADASGRPTWYA